MKPSTLSRQPAPRTGTPRVSLLQAAVASAFVALPMLLAAAPAAAVQFTVTNLETLEGLTSDDLLGFAGRATC